MEKFTDWRDKGTGIAPFLPQTPLLSLESGVRRIANNGILVLKLIITLPLILISSLLYWTPLKKPLWKLLLKLLCNFQVQVTCQGVKKRDLSSKHLPRKGQLYLVNYTSPLDALALYFSSQGEPVFLIPHVKDKDVKLYKLRVLEFIQFTLRGSLFEDGDNFPTISQLSDVEDYTAFLFPEGTSSNGKSILPFAVTQEFLDEFVGQEEGVSNSVSNPQNKLRGDWELQTISLKVNTVLVTPLKIGSWKYLVRMSSTGVNYKCKISEPTGGKIDQLRTVMCGGDKYKLVGKELNVASKKRFVKAYGDRRR